ncbi:hypothetical protein CAT7_00960 [Carnobacterium sp. AT7]|nr:hypothetical protein CAT7_00960 [Carnobacterium sp. AT7]
MLGLKEGYYIKFVVLIVEIYMSNAYIIL